MNLGTRVKQMRKDRGLTQKQFASVIKCHWRTINNLETGKANTQTVTLMRIARFFGVSIDVLMNGNHPCGAAGKGHRHPMKSLKPS